jgi:hypothetical protein
MSSPEQGVGPIKPKLAKSELACFHGSRPLRPDPADLKRKLTLQLPFMQISESMGNHDSKIVDAASVD